MSEDTVQVTLTEKAALRLKRTMEEKNLQAYGLRVYVKKGGCAGYEYGLDLDNEVRKDDRVYESQGIKVFIDAISAPRLKGSKVDYSDELIGGGFKIENPNVIAMCVCGISFKTEGKPVVEKTCDTPAESSFEV